MASTRPELTGDFGMVASTHWLASQIGMSVLERGGNAADAAVAAGFLLQVVEPHLNGPGGEVPILVADPDGDAVVICGQGDAPAAATIDAFVGLGLDAIPGTGLLAATVPGAFGAWTVLLERYGTWTLRQVLEPVIGYAEAGVPVLPRVASTLTAMAQLFGAEWTPSAATYLDRGAAPQAWDRMRLPGLAATYRRILAEAEAGGADRGRQLAAARDAWYRGFVAEAIGTFCERTAWLDGSGQRHGGLLRADDLARWQPPVEAPARARFGDIEVLKAGPWSQGPVLLQQLLLLDALGLDVHDLGGLGPDALGPDFGGSDPGGSDPGGCGPVDPDGLHALIECQKLAFADREAWYGDPDHVDVPLDDLLSAPYARQRLELLDPGAASRQLRPGSPGGRTPHLPPLPDYAAGGVPIPGKDPAAAPLDPVDGVPLLSGGEPTARTATLGDHSGVSRGDTCHVDVVDRNGMMIAATPSGGWLQSSPVIPQLGFPLGTRAQMFWLHPGLPSSLRPRSRPRTTLSPSLAFRDGLPWLAFGTPGGDQQDQWSLLLLLRLVAGAAGRQPVLQAAVDAPMLHTDHAPSSFHPRSAVPGRAVLEDRWPEQVRTELARRGHDLVTVPGWTLGRLSVVARERRPDGVWLRAAANPRGGTGYATGR